MSKLSEAYVRSRKNDELLEINKFETFKNIITLQYLDSAKIADCNKIGQGKLKQMLAAASRISSQICLAIQPKTRISFDRSLRRYDFKTKLLNDRRDTVPAKMQSPIYCYQAYRYGEVKCNCTNIALLMIEGVNYQTVSQTCIALLIVNNLVSLSIICL